MEQILTKTGPSWRGFRSSSEYTDSENKLEEWVGGHFNDQRPLNDFEYRIEDMDYNPGTDTKFLVELRDKTKTKGFVFFVNDAEEEPSFSPLRKLVRSSYSEMKRRIFQTFDVKNLFGECSCLSGFYWEESPHLDLGVLKGSFDDETNTCPDCEVDKGNYHEQRCDIEECPFCHEQSIGCNCRFEQLNLIDFEENGYRTRGLPKGIYENDLTEELERSWEDILERKVRIPYGEETRFSQES